MRPDVVEDLNRNGDVVTTYLNGPGLDNKIRQSDATNGNLYFLMDHLGSTRGLTDDSGNVVEQINYDSFGNSAGSAFTRYDYTGRERDPDTELMYYRARWYDPQVGRLISEDPIGFTGESFNLRLDLCSRLALTSRPCRTAPGNSHSSALSFQPN